jgi:hypothetical protein
LNVFSRTVTAPEAEKTDPAMVQGHHRNCYQGLEQHL